MRILFVLFIEKHIYHCTLPLIYQSKADLDVKSLFGKVNRLLDPEIMEMLIRVIIGPRIPRSILVHDLYLPLKFKFYGNSTTEVDHCS